MFILNIFGLTITIEREATSRLLHEIKRNEQINKLEEERNRMYAYLLNHLR